jgi:Tripartite tricarboxylate transporter family receptor
VPQLRNTLLATATMLALAIPQFAAAQDYPSRPVRVVVAFPPGGPTDFVGRLITDKMSALLGQRLYIENRAGANGTVGADNVAKSDPDGYSLFLTTAGAVAMSPHIMESIPYDALHDFAPVAEVVTNTTLFVVRQKMESQRPRNWRRSPNRSPARSPSPRPAPVRRRTLLKSSSPTPPEFNSFTCPTVARRRRLPTFLLVRCRCLPPTFRCSFRRFRSAPSCRSVRRLISEMKWRPMSQHSPSRATPIPMLRIGMRCWRRPKLRPR